MYSLLLGPVEKRCLHLSKPGGSKLSEQGALAGESADGALPF